MRIRKPRFLMQREEREINDAIKNLRKLIKARIGIKKPIILGWFWKKKTLEEIKTATNEIIEDAVLIKKNLKNFEGNFKSLKLPPLYNDLKIQSDKVLTKLSEMLKENDSTHAMDSGDRGKLQILTKDLELIISQINHELEYLIESRRKFIRNVGIGTAATVVGGPILWKTLISESHSKANPHLKNIQLSAYGSKDDANKGIEILKDKLQRNGFSELVPYMLINKHDGHYRIILKLLTPFNAARTISKKLKNKNINNAIFSNIFEFNNDDVSILPVDENYTQLILKYLSAYTSNEIKDRNDNILRPIVQSGIKVYLPVKIKYLKPFYLKNPDNYLIKTLLHGESVTELSGNINTASICKFSGIDTTTLNEIATGCFIGIPSTNIVPNYFDPNIFFKSRPRVYDKLIYKNLHRLKYTNIKFYPTGMEETYIQRIYCWIPIFKAVANKYSMDWQILAAIAMQESYAGEKLLNQTPDGGAGFCHTQAKTGKEYGIKTISNPNTYVSKQDAKDATKLMDKYNNQLELISKEDERFHPIINIDMTARIVTRGYYNSKDWKRGIMFFRIADNSTNDSKEIRRNYLAMIQNQIDRLNNKELLLRATKQFNKDNNGIRFDSFIADFQKANYNWGLSIYQNEYNPKFPK